MPVAKSMSEALQTVSGAEDVSVQKKAVAATLGTPEILITIVVTAAAKAVVISGLHALEASLERLIDRDKDRRTQIILTDEASARRERFPISLRGVSKDAVKEFVKRVESAISAF